MSDKIKENRVSWEKHAKLVLATKYGEHELASAVLILLSELEAAKEYFRIKQDQVWELDAERMSLQQQLNDLQLRNADLACKNADLKQQLDAAKSEKYDLHITAYREIETIQQQLDAAKEDVEKLLSANDRLSKLADDRRDQWQLTKRELDASKQENERLRKLYEREREIAENAVNIQSGYMNHLQQRLKQAIESMEQSRMELLNAFAGARNIKAFKTLESSLSILREETNPDTAAAPSGLGDSVGSE